MTVSRFFRPASRRPLSDFAQNATETVAHVFTIAVRMSAPFLVVGLVFYFGLGLLNKLMPQMQIFFIAMPVNIAIGLFLLMVLIVDADDVLSRPFPGIDRQVHRGVTPSTMADDTDDSEKD